MIHSMKLNEVPFNMIKVGNKSIELRLYDDKRKKMKVGDIIIFTKRSNDKEKLITVIKALYLDNSFKDLFEKIPLDKCGMSNKLTEEQVTECMRIYYSKEEEEKYGVVGIEIELTELS